MQYRGTVCTVTLNSISAMALISLLQLIRASPLLSEALEMFISSGVGTVAAVAALAATLFRPYINIHNLLS